MSEIIYGVRKTDGKVISIEEVSEDMPGLSCMCVCAYCGRDLQACSLKSVKVSRYFRHQNTTNSNGEGTFICNPIIANETALHKMAKQFIADLKYSIELANAKFGEDAALASVTAEDGDVSAVVYTIGNATVTIDTDTKTATAAAITGKTVTEAKLAEYKAAAEDVIDTIDWDYDFKHADYQSGYTVSAGDEGAGDNAGGGN